MSGVGESAPGEGIHDLPPADSMEVVDSADSGPVVEAKADIGAQEGASSCAAASETAASTVGTGADLAAATASVEGGSPGVTEELTKVTVFNVGMHATSVQLEKLLKKNGIAYKRARKPPSISHAILTFETEDQRTTGMEQIGKLRGPRGGELMYAVLTKHNTNKRGAEGGGRGGDGSKRPRQEEAKTVAQATASLYGVKTYAEQLAFKEQTLMDDLFFRLPALIRKEWDKRYGEWKRNQGIKQGKQPGGGKLTSPPELKCPSWCRTFKRRNGTVPFDVLPIVASPEQEGYRNKCEFTISLGADGLATTGFRAGRFNADVPITVESPKDCPQVHRDMKTLCVQMDAFMRSSPFLPYEDTSKKGVWRFLLVRRSVADNETMAKLVVNLTGVAETEEWKKEEQRLVKELSEGAQGQEGTRLVSLWIQEYEGVSSPDETSPLRLLWGKERIEEKLLGLRFTISPNSFFQVNTQGAEALYRVVIENLELGDDVMVLDVCCGAGTIGICAAAAGGAKRVFGADLCLPAIEDAKVNAEANGIKNCEFVCGKAEAVVGGQIAKAIKQHKQESREAAEEAVSAAKASELEETADGAPSKEPVCSELKFAAVVDPPRSGVHAKCLRSIRGTKAIKRLVYVSCNPTKSLPADALILCCPVSNSTTGVPFRPVKAIPVDMFPHTPHMELVMVFERVEPETEQAPPSAAKPAAEPTAQPAAEPAAQPAAKPVEATATGEASPDSPPGEVAHHSSGSPIPVADEEAGGSSGAGEASEASEAGKAAAEASEVAKASAVVTASEGVKVSEDAARVSEAAGAGEAAQACEAAAPPSEAAKASADTKASEEAKTGEEA